MTVCQCGNCIPMPTPDECVCCKEITATACKIEASVSGEIVGCITDFSAVCLRGCTSWLFQLPVSLRHLWCSRCSYSWVSNTSLRPMPRNSHFLHSEECSYSHTDNTGLLHTDSLQVGAGDGWEEACVLLYQVVLWRGKFPSADRFQVSTLC